MNWNPNKPKGTNVPPPARLPKAPPRATNCPNCGAPIEGAKCPYCGTLLLDFADIEMDQPSFVRIKVGGNIMMLRVIPRSLDISYDEQPILYADNVPFRIVSPPSGKIGLRMDIVSDEDGVWMRKKAVSE